MSMTAAGRRARRAAATAGLTAALLASGTSLAQAAGQDAALGANEGRAFHTWFWGRTQVCVQNLDPTFDASYSWVSSTSSGGGGLTPGEERCMTRSFAGFDIYVSNLSPRATIQVRFPIGP